MSLISFCRYCGLMLGQLQITTAKVFSAISDQPQCSKDETGVTEENTARSEQWHTRLLEESNDGWTGFHPGIGPYGAHNASVNMISLWSDDTSQCLWGYLAPGDL